MTQTRRLNALGFALAAIVCSVGFNISLEAQGDPGTMIQDKLVSEIKVTKTNGAHDDIVTAGDVMLLHKDGLMMCSVSSSYAFSNSYSNGVLSANYGNRAKDAAKSWLKGKLPMGGGGSMTDAANNGCPQRRFNSGEKFWITKIAAVKDGVIVSVYSDPYKDASGTDTRYYGEIKFPFRGSFPAPDNFVKTFDEVMTVVPSDDKGSDQTAAKDTPAAAPAPAAPEPAMAAIAPPPPPADAPPPTVEVGETKDQVVASFGQPTRIMKPSPVREIYVYKDMKVTFTKGKVSDIQ